MCSTKSPHLHLHICVVEGTRTEGWNRTDHHDDCDDAVTVCTPRQRRAYVTIRTYVRLTCALGATSWRYGLTPEPGQRAGYNGLRVHVLWIVRSELALIIAAFACRDEDATTTRPRRDATLRNFPIRLTAGSANIRIERVPTDICLSRRFVSATARERAPADRETRRLNLYREIRATADNFTRQIDRRQVTTGRQQHAVSYPIQRSTQRLQHWKKRDNKPFPSQCEIHISSREARFRETDVQLKRRIFRRAIIIKPNGSASERQASSE